MACLDAVQIQWVNHLHVCSFKKHCPMWVMPCKKSTQNMDDEELFICPSLSLTLSHSIVLSTLHCWVHNCLVMLIEVEIHVPPQKNCEIKNLTGITVEWNSEFDRSGYFQMARRGQQWHYELYYSNWLSTMYSVWVITSNKMPQIRMLYTKG